MIKPSTAINVLLSLAGFCVIVLLLGATYNFLSIRHDRAAVMMPGKIVNAGGYPMHIYCTGQGSPTLILDAGLGDDSLIWAKVQPELSKVTSVCSYDRAGFGWSASRPGLQDADAVATQLHQLLIAAGITQPVILMGHSIAGIYLRAYAMLYQNNLAGLVFVDGATPLQDDRMPPALVKIEQQQRRGMAWQYALMFFGWDRLNGLCDDIEPGFAAYAGWIKADSCIPSQITAIDNELDAERTSGEETIHAGPFASLPILIFSHDPKTLPSNWPTDVAKAQNIVWNNMQEESKHLSSNSRRIIARGSDHYIHIDRPDLINKEVAIFISEIRTHQTLNGSGTTIEE